MGHGCWAIFFTFVYLYLFFSLFVFVYDKWVEIRDPTHWFTMLCFVLSV